MKQITSRGTKVHYAKAGMFDHSDVRIYTKARDIPNLGNIEAPNRLQGRILLVAGVDVQFAMRAVPQRRGGVKFALDQKLNPDTVSLLPSGQFDEHTVVAGNFGTCTDPPAPLALLGRLNRIAKKKWKRTKSYLVSLQKPFWMPEAGLRPEYDLHR
ncbi:MAG TPA: hypothetical protein PLS23_17500 [Phycisphaerae bacterium]|nr:hypothetical protein [Phycisphaerae bacterium]HON68287.1 hypothetical protein [Phycisphaerae bacterium]